MTPENANIIAGVVSGLIGSAGAFLAVFIGLRRLESQEFRRVRVNLLLELYSLRAAMHDDASIELRRRFAYEYNKVTLLFSDHPKVVELWRDFYKINTNENFLSFLREAARVAGMDTSSLRNDDIRAIYLESGPLKKGASNNRTNEADS